jgi:hypothetical protein
MFGRISFVINLALAGLGLGFFLVVLGAVKLGSALMIGGALVAYLLFMLWV